MMLSTNEERQLHSIADRLRLLRSLNVLDHDSLSEPAELLAALRAVKEIQGNLSNDVSSVACVLAKSYLLSEMNAVGFDALAKPQGASGYDIEARLRDGSRVVGEIKTTEPCNGSSFGAAQDKGIRSDLDRLRKADADVRVMFVVSERAFSALERRMASHSFGILLVLLPSGKSLRL